jgi:hypothetical protein
MIPSATELGASGLLYAAPSSPQVTTGCDPVLIYQRDIAQGNPLSIGTLKTLTLVVGTKHNINRVEV